MAPPLRVLLLIALALVSATTLASPPNAEIPLPGGEGLAQRHYRSPIFRVGSQRVQITLERPDGWHSQSDDFSFILEPDPNPGDLGFFTFVFSTTQPEPAFAPIVSPEGLPAFLEGVVAEPQEQSRETLSLRTAQGSSFDATLMRFTGRFDNGQVAHLLVLHATHQDVGYVILAGASDRAFGPYSNALRDMITSISINTAPDGS